MGRTSMDWTLSRGAAAALLALSAGSLAAQVAPSRARDARRDSVIMRAFEMAKTDTITTIFRALTHEEYGSPAYIELSRKLDSLVMSGARVMIRAEGRGENGLARVRMVTPRGWIGFNAQGPMQKFFGEDGERVTYLTYPSIISVDAGSPADKAGIVPGDLLIAFNGTDVVGNEFNLTKLFTPEKKVGVTVRRDGETKDYSLDVVRAPEPVASRRIEFNRVPMPPMPPSAVGSVRVEIDTSEFGRVVARRPAGTTAVMVGPRAGGGSLPGGILMAGRFNVITPHGVWGASVSPVGDDLAKVLKLEKGVLVNEIPESSPAFKSGLRAGDVIVNAAGQTVTTLNQLQDQILSRLAERSIALQLMRNHKPAAITVKW